jgi:hypothetical protein
MRHRALHRPVCNRPRTLKQRTQTDLWDIVLSMNMAHSRGKIPVLGLVAVALAILTAGVVALLPCTYASQSSQTTIGPEGTTTQSVSNSCRSLIEVNGIGTLIFLFVPAVLALVALLGFTLRRKAVYIAATVVLGLLCIVTGFSIGLFFFPTLIMLIVASATWSTRPG